MATIDFPTSPSLNQTYSFGGKTWSWNGYAWDLQSSGAINATPIGNASPSTGVFTQLSATGNVSVTGNVTGANFSTAGIVSAAGNIVGARLSVNGNVNSGNIIASGSVYSGNVVVPNQDQTIAYIIAF